MAKKSTRKSANGAGNIRLISSTRNGKTYTYWQARITTGHDPGTGRQIQRSITGKTQKEVAEKLRQLTHELDKGTYLAPSRLTLQAWMETWLDEYLGNVKEATRFLYRKNTESYIVPHLGSIKLEALNAPMVQSFYNDLVNPKENDVRPLSPKTVKNVHGVLHKALQQAVLVGYIRTNPSDACTLPKVIKKDIQPLDADQIKLFLEAVEDHPHELLYKIALFTGLRQGELLGLTWDCIDFDRSTLLVRQQLRREQKKGGQYYITTPKNGKSRSITLAPSVLRLFRLQKLHQNFLRAAAGDEWDNSEDMVFTNQTGGYLSYRTVYDCFKRIVKKIGIPNVRFHDLRHSYAVASIQAGDDIKTVQENLGHATASFTLDVYGHVTAQMRKNSAERMERFIQEVSGKQTIPE